MLSFYSDLSFSIEAPQGILKKSIAVTKTMLCVGRGAASHFAPDSKRKDWDSTLRPSHLYSKRSKCHVAEELGDSPACHNRSMGYLYTKETESHVLSPAVSPKSIMTLRHRRCQATDITSAIGSRGVTIFVTYTPPGDLGRN